MVRKGFAASLAWGMFLFVLAACGNGAKGSETGGAQQQSNTETKPKEPVELVFFSLSGGSEEAFNQKYGDAVKAKFPDYTIKFIRSEPGKTLPDLLAAKQRIDFVFNVFDYALDPLFSYNLQYDMTDLAKKHQVDLTQIEPTLMDAVKNAGNGKLYLLPTDQQIQVVYYNKGIFDKFGVPYPRNGMTWDETLELSKKLTRKDGEKQYLGFAASPAFIFKTNPFSEPYLDPKTEKSTFERDTWKKLIQTAFISPSQDQGYKDRVGTLKAIPYRLEFTNTQELAMFAFHSEFPVSVPKDLEKIDWDMVALPTFKELSGVGAQASPVGLAITSMAQNKDAAMEVLKYILSKENQTAISKKGMIPVLTDESVKKVFSQDSPFKGKNWGAVFYNKLAPIPYKSVYELKIENIYAAAAANIVKGTTDLNTALREAAEKANQAVADEKASKK